jgi:hypothetical protein
MLAVAFGVVDHEIANALVHEPEARLVLSHPLLSPPHECRV